jgi:hypothetical protein
MNLMVGGGSRKPNGKERAGRKLGYEWDKDRRALRDGYMMKVDSDQRSSKAEADGNEGSSLQHRQANKSTR